MAEVIVTECRLGVEEVLREGGGVLGGEVAMIEFCLWAECCSEVAEL